MTRFEKIRQMNIDEFAAWLDDHGEFDGSPWLSWWNDTYCKKCDPVMGRYADSNKDMEFSWCELNDGCRFFPEKEFVPDMKQIIKMWLESEYESET